MTSKLFLKRLYQVNTDRERFRSRRTISEFPLNQIKLLFDCDKLDSDEISELLFELGCLSVSCEVAGERLNTLNDEKNWEDLAKTKNWQTATLRAAFASSFDIDGVIEILKSTYDGIETEKIIMEPIEDKDWVQHVQISWKPFIFEDLTVKFPWHTENSTTAKELHLEGGAAFGTGDHPTTRLCVSWIRSKVLDYIQRGQPDITVLDYGCGSAILGMVGLLYGATYAAGVDIDLDALSSAQRNCRLNNLHMDFYMVNEENNPSSSDVSLAYNEFRGKFNEDKDFIQPLKNLDRKFPLVISNILAPILIDLAPNLAKLTSSTGEIALSGVVIQQADAVISAYEPYYNNMKVERVENDWVLITGQRK
jgi:ribosomal protein L11 methyltransferase